MTEIEKEILRIEENLTQTEMKLDVEALDRIYADDIMVTAPIGVCVDKPAVMNEVRLAAAKAVIGKYDKGDLKVRAYGDTAVSSYRMTAEATFEGVEIKQTFCITNVWMKRRTWHSSTAHTSLAESTPSRVRTDRDPTGNCRPDDPCSQRRGWHLLPRGARATALASNLLYVDSTAWLAR